MQRIFLIGYMGAGKTTLGRSLSKALNLQFIDLDDFIEARYHKTIKDIFASDGEAGFREIERRSLAEVAEYEDVVISLGGGTPCFFDNMEVVRRSGRSIYLKPSEEVLLERLIIGKQKRPLLADKSDDQILQVIREQLAWREPYYLKAEMVYDASSLESRQQIEQSTATVVKMLGQK